MALRSFVTDLLGILYVWVNGVQQPQSSGIEFLGDGITQIYDPALNRNQIIFESAAGDVSGPEASSDNQIALFNGVTGKAIKGGALSVDDDGSITLPNGALVRSSKVLWETNFQAETPYVFVSNGDTRAVNGRNVITDNFAAATLMSISNADGLKITTTTANTVYDDAPITAPNFIIPFSDFDFTAGPIRVLVDYDVSSIAVDFQFLGISLEWGQHRKMNLGAKLGHASTLKRFGYINEQIAVKTESVGQAATTTGTAEIWFKDFNSVNVRFGAAYSGAWPVIATPEASLFCVDRRQVEAGGSTVVQDPTNPIGYQLCISAQTASTTAWTAKIKRIRVEQIL